MKTFYFVFISLAVVSQLKAQDKYELSLNLTLFDHPQNIKLPHRYPSMGQAVDWSANFYELGFFGIDKLGDLVFKPDVRINTGLRKVGKYAFRYALGLGFARYGSELPIPLGVWAHEEFHRTILGLNGISSKNGNWLFSRWDGTVYGVTDESLQNIKATRLNDLLYSYVAGVQYEILLNEKITIEDFNTGRTFPKGPLVLYNAWYVWNYFKFSTSPASDSVKVLAPPNENPDPFERDYAGSDLTAWVSDMFNPTIPYTDRDLFPGGDGVNRRIGFADLSPEEKEYLQDQKKLSLLNFFNPAIFMIDRIRLSPNLSFNFFTQYAPTHFGNAVSLHLPFKYKTTGFLVSAHRYSGHESEGYGIGLGLLGLRVAGVLLSDFRINVWDQPKSFYSDEKNRGGWIWIRARYPVTKSFTGYIATSWKTDGWMLGHPFLVEKTTAQIGVSWQLAAR